jgi:hypothetical protein
VYLSMRDICLACCACMLYMSRMLCMLCMCQAVGIGEAG